MPKTYSGKGRAVTCALCVRMVLVYGRKPTKDLLCRPCRSAVSEPAIKRRRAFTDEELGGLGFVG